MFNPDLKWIEIEEDLEDLKEDLKRVSKMIEDAGKIFRKKIELVKKSDDISDINCDLLVLQAQAIFSLIESAAKKSQARVEFGIEDLDYSGISYL